MSQSGKIVPSMGGTPIETITGNIGGAVSPTANNIALLGSGLITVTGNPLLHSLTISNSGSVPAQFTTNFGIATPTLNNLNVLGDGININTYGTGDQVWVLLSEDISVLSSITMQNAGNIQTGPIVGETLRLNAYNTGTLTYTNFATLTAGAAPTMDLSDSVTKATKYIYREDGTDVATKDGGLGTSSLPLDGQIPIGVTATNTYTPATLTAGAGIGIANAAGSITISAGGAVPTTFNTDAGAAVPALNILQVLGGVNIGTTGAGSTVTINLDTALTGITNITTTAGAALRTGITAGDTTLLQAYNNTGATYTTFGTLTANLVPTFDLASSVTIGTAYPYRVGGTDVAITDGGTSLSTTPTDGQLLVGNTAGNNYVLATLTPGTGIGVANAGGSITVSTAATVPLSFPTDSGTATPAVNALTIAGGTNIGSTGAASTITLNLDSALTAIDSVTVSNGGSLRTGTTAADTLLLRAYDVDGIDYKTFGTLTANNTPTFDLDTDVTINSSYIYRAGGTDVAIADGGTGLSTTPTDGQLLIGKTATNNYSLATLTAGTGIGIANAGGSITVSGAATVPLSFPTDSGTATPAVNALTVTGGTNIGTTGAAAAVTINLDTDLTGITSLTASNGGALRTGTTAADTLLLRAYNTGGASYTTFGTLTAHATTPTFDLSDSVTKSGAYIYRAGGTDVAVADGGTGVSTAPTNGQLLIGSTGVGYVVGSLTAGSNITITPGAGSISIAASGGMTWSEQTGASFNIAVDNGYVCNRGTLITATLPASAAVGKTFRLAGKGAGLYTIAQAAGQTIHYGNQNTTTGAGGSLTATNQYDCIELVCSTADTDFVVLSSVGNFTVV